MRRKNEVERENERGERRKLWPGGEEGDEREDILALGPPPPA